MPNHCENQLYVSGPKPEIDELTEYFRTRWNAEDNNGILSGLIPMPACLEGTRYPSVDIVSERERLLKLFKDGKLEEERYIEILTNTEEEHERNKRAQIEVGYESWYEWANDVWGTKWGDYDAYAFEEFDYEFFYGFHTAWGPFHHPFFEKLSAMFPKLYFSNAYLEIGMGFMGVTTWNNGMLVHEDEDDTTVEGIDMDDEENGGYEKWDEAVRMNFDCMFENARAHHPYPKEGWRVI